jgi:hypothetical protein
MANSNIRAHHHLLHNSQWVEVTQDKLLLMDRALSLTISPTRVHPILRRINTAAPAMFVVLSAKYDRVIITNTAADHILSHRAVHHLVSKAATELLLQANILPQDSMLLPASSSMAALQAVSRTLIISGS